MEITLPPKSDNSCFGCGASNKMGLQLTFHGDPEHRSAWTEFEPQSFMAGGLNMMHGGFIALLLDEASSKVLSVIGKHGVTRHIDVSYEKPVPLGTMIRVEAALTSHEGRKHNIEAKLLNPAGDILARSKALFLTIRQE